MSFPVSFVMRSALRDCWILLCQPKRWIYAGVLSARLLRLGIWRGGALLALPGLWVQAWLHGWSALLHTETIWLVLGALWARGLGCAYNDWVDQPWDGRVARTRKRPLCAHPRLVRRVRIPLAVLLGLWAAGPLVVWIAVLPTSAWKVGAGAAMGVLIYPWAKRWLQWPQAVLAAVFSSAVPMMMALQHARPPQIYDTPSAAPMPWMVGAMIWGAAALWVLVYDTIYAYQDRQDDLACGLGSTAVVLGTGPLAVRTLSFWIYARYGLLLVSVGGLWPWNSLMILQAWPLWAAWGALSCLALWEQKDLRRGPLSHPHFCANLFARAPLYGVLICIILACASLGRQHHSPDPAPSDPLHQDALSCERGNLLVCDPSIRTDAGKNPRVRPMA